MPSIPGPLRRFSSDFRVRLSSRAQPQPKDRDDSPLPPATAPARPAAVRHRTTASSDASASTSPRHVDTPSPPLEVPHLDPASSASDEDSPHSPQSPPDIAWHDPLWSEPPPNYHDVVTPRQARKAQRAIVRQRPVLAAPEQTPSPGPSVPEPEQSTPAEVEAVEAAVASPTLEEIVSLVPESVWTRIAGFCSPATAATLALTSHAWADRVGGDCFKLLNRPENKHEKIAFLVHFNKALPDQLLCFLCAKYHRRLGADEQLTSSVLQNPIFTCPSIRTSRPAPRLRLSHDRELPFSLVQLAMRAETYSKGHGTSLKAISKHWIDHWSGWDYRTKFLVSEGHLLMRVKSTITTRGRLAPSEMRLLLLDRTEYAPYFSVCQHWACESTLTSLCKCALKHIPVGKATKIPGSCADCRPLRRCYHCPTEYLIQVKLKEVKDEEGRPEFEYALSVTRWSDLGDGINALTSREWLAINDEADYDEMQRVGDLSGLRTLRRRFESRLGQRVPEVRAVPLRVPQVWRSRNPLLWTEEQRWMEEQKAFEGVSMPVLGGGARSNSGSAW